MLWCLYDPGVCIKQAFKKRQGLHALLIIDIMAKADIFPRKPCLNS